MSHAHPVHREFRVTRDVVVGSVDTSRNWSRKPSKSPPQERNISPPTQANNTTHNGIQLNTPTGATTWNPPTRALHAHQTRTRHMHQDATHATEVAPVNKQSPAPAEARVGVAPEYTPGIHSDGCIPSQAPKQGRRGPMQVRLASHGLGRYHAVPLLLNHRCKALEV